MEYHEFTANVIDQINQLKLFGNTQAFQDNMGNITFPCSGDYTSPEYQEIESKLREHGFLKPQAGLTYAAGQDYSHVKIPVGALVGAEQYHDELFPPGNQKLYSKFINQDGVADYRARINQSIPNMQDVVRYINSIQAQPENGEEGNPGAKLALIAKIVGEDNPESITEAVKNLVYRQRKDLVMKEQFNQAQKELQTPPENSRGV